MVRLNRYPVNGVLVALVVCCSGGLAWSAPAAYTFTTVDIPLAVPFNGEVRHDIVRFTDINAHGELVGSDFASDGFIVTPGGQVTELHCPGSRTDDYNPAAAINNRGAVVGSCTLGASPEPRSVGFVRDQSGTFTLLSYPGADGTSAWGINDLGHVVGQYWGFQFGQAGDRFHGFLWQGGVYTTLDAPFEGAMGTVLWGINNAGQIIGTYQHHRAGSSDINDTDRAGAFFYTQGTFRPLEMPGAVNPSPCCGWTTFPMDINNRGQVVGSTYDSAGQEQFFLYEAGRYRLITGVPTNIDFLDSWGLNDQGDITGTYSQQFPCAHCGPNGEPYYTTEIHSFIATPSVAVPTLPLVSTVSGDFDGNGEDDLAGMDAQHSVWQCLAGAPACQALGGWVSTLVAGDFDGDGVDDLAALSGWGIWLYTTAHGWQQIPGMLNTLVAGDFYGDGRMHLAGLSGWGIWVSPSLGAWQQLPGILTTLVLGDFDGDGLDDLAGIAPDYSIWVHTAAHGWRFTGGWLSTLDAVHQPTSPDTLIGDWANCTYELIAWVWHTRGCTTDVAQGRQAQQ